MTACEGALLVVDATQGIEAQTLANAYLAVDHDLEIIPVINKIDLPELPTSEQVQAEIEDVIGHCLPRKHLPSVGKDRDEHRQTCLDADRRATCPAPEGDDNAPLKALIFDSYYDSYQRRCGLCPHHATETLKRRRQNQADVHRRGATK